MDLLSVDPDGKNAWLLDGKNAWEIDGLKFELGSGLGGFAHFITKRFAAQLMLKNTVLSPYLETGTDLFAACATSFKGNMYLFGGVTVNKQVTFNA